MPDFRVGVTPDFYTDAKGRFEPFLEAQFAGVAGLEWGSMRPQPGGVATPEALDEFDAIFSLALRFTADSLKGVERLAVVARWGVGYDMIDTAALTEADVALAITPDAVRRPVAEAILTFIFALTTNLMEQDRTVRRGQWRGALERPGRNLKGRVLGSIGCGNIAQELFRLVQSLNFGRLLACDPYVKTAPAGLNVEMVSLDELLRQSDFVTVNSPLNAETRGMIGERELKLMKPSAFLINTARGPIVQQAALAEALRERWIAGAGLDVFEQEPLPAGDPIRDAGNAILTPHGLAWTEEIVRDNSLEACANILAVAGGAPPPGIVNRAVLSRPGFQKKLAAYKNRL